jgi:hypothetical protein
MRSSKLRAINLIFPSFGLSYDPVQVSFPRGGNLQVVPITGLKLISPAKKEIFRNRPEKVFPMRTECRRLSVVIPFRHRYRHLGKIIPSLKGTLERQGIDHEILVVHQDNNKLFNRGKLLNIGAMEARAESEYLCLHDVDLLPLEADYRYCTCPVRLPGIIEADFHYDAVVDDRGTVNPLFFSGAIVIDREAFKKVNGFSNDYWHWGMEDRDFFMRLLFGGLVPLYSPDSRFKALYHEKSVFISENGRYETSAAERERLGGSYRRNVRLFKLYKRRVIGNESGLSSIEYKVRGRETCDGFTMITVSL